MSNTKNNDLHKAAQTMGHAGGSAPHANRDNKENDHKEDGRKHNGNEENLKGHSKK